MLSSTQDELFERIVEHLDSGTDPMADQVMEYPVERYVQADHLDREGALLFGKLPLVVGASDRVRSPGDFFTDDLSGWSLLVVRGDDGVLRGFHNMCGHRGSEVKVRESGCSRSFTCPYHAWTYDSEGRLVAIPNDDGFAGLDRSDRGLIEVPVEERHGLVWAQPNSAPGTSLDVAGYLGELDAQLGEFELHKLRSRPHGHPPPAVQLEVRDRRLSRDLPSPVSSSQDHRTSHPLQLRNVRHLRSSRSDGRATLLF